MPHTIGQTRTRLMVRVQKILVDWKIQTRRNSDIEIYHAYARSVLAHIGIKSTAFCNKRHANSTKETMLYLLFEKQRVWAACRGVDLWFSPISAFWTRIGKLSEKIKWLLFKSCFSRNSHRPSRLTFWVCCTSCWLGWKNTVGKHVIYRTTSTLSEKTAPGETTEPIATVPIATVPIATVPIATVPISQPKIGDKVQYKFKLNDGSERWTEGIIEKVIRKSKQCTVSFPSNKKTGTYTMKKLFKT